MAGTQDTNAQFGCKACANTKWLARPSNPGVFFPDGADVQWLVLKRTIPEGEMLWWAWGDGEYEKEWLVIRLPANTDVHSPCPPAEKRKSRGGSIASFVVPDWEPPIPSPTQAEPEEKKPKKRVRTYSGSKRTIKKPRRPSSDHQASSPSAPRSSSTGSLSPPPPVRRRLPSETPEPSPIPEQSSESPWVETPAADEEGTDLVMEQTQVDVNGMGNRQDESYDTTMQPVADDDKAEERMDQPSSVSERSRQSSVSDLTTVLQTASSPMSAAKVSPKAVHNDGRQPKPTLVRMTTEPTFAAEPSSAGAVSSELTPVAQLAPAVQLAPPLADAPLAPASDGHVEHPANMQSVVQNLIQNVVPGTVPAQLLSAGHTSEETTILNLRLVVSSETLRNAAPATDPALEERVAALEADLDEQKSRNDALQQENASLKESVQQHNAVVSQHQADMSDVQSENASLQVQKDALEHDKAKLLKEIDGFKKQIAKSNQDTKKLEKDAKQAQGNYKEAQQDIKTIRREKDEVEKRCQILAEEIEKLCRDKEKLSEDRKSIFAARIFFV